MDSFLETRGFTADRVVNKPHRRKKRTSKAGTFEPRHLMLAVRCTVRTKMKPFTSHISDSSEETHRSTHVLTLSISIFVRSSRLTATEYEWTCECTPPHRDTPRVHWLRTSWVLVSWEHSQRSGRPTLCTHSGN